MRGVSGRIESALSRQPSVSERRFSSTYEPYRAGCRWASSGWFLPASALVVWGNMKGRDARAAALDRVWRARSGRQFPGSRYSEGSSAGPRTPARPSPSTRFTRWRAGPIFRLWTAMTAGMGVLLLSEFAGSPMMVNTFFALFLISVGVDAGHCSRASGVNVGNSVETPHDGSAGLASCDPTICHLPSRFITTSLYT